MRTVIVTGSREANALARVLPEAVCVDGGSPGEIANATAVIDASHPCERDTHDAVQALCLRESIPLLRLRRPEWSAVAGDRWIEVNSAKAAHAALPPTVKRVFLCLSASDRTAFRGDEARWYLIRSRKDDRAREGLADFDLTTQSGPYSAESEAALMRAHRIDTLITRNAGGAGAYPKIAAANALGLRVILLNRPAVTCQTASTVEDATAWLAAL